MRDKPREPIWEPNEGELKEGERIILIGEYGEKKTDIESSMGSLIGPREEIRHINGGKRYPGVPKHMALSEARYCIVRKPRKD